MLVGFIVSIAANIASFFLGIASRLLWQHYQMLKYRPLWGPFIVGQSETVAILTTRPGPNVNSTPRVSLNEMQAFIDLQEMFRRLKHKLVPIASDTQDITSLSNHNIIIIGGPKANQVSDAAWSMIMRQLPITVDTSSQVLIKVADRIYEAEYDKNGDISTDYGVVIRINNPFDTTRNRHALLAFGCHGHGTYGAIRTVTDPSLLKAIYQKVGTSDFLAIIKINLHDKAIVSAKMVECYNIVASHQIITAV